MNHGIFKLVYSRVLNMYVPASEAVKSHAGKTARVRKHAKQTIELMLVGFIFYASSSLADTATEVNLRSAVNATVQSAVNSTIVRQSSARAILDWNRLNIGKGYNLQFDQQGNRTWSALNRIHDLSPTILNGNIKADGNVYFINTNGIVFGADSQFNVGSLYAGTLDITDNLFNDGFIDSSGLFTPVFQAVGEISTGKLVIEPGATINTAKNGKVVLFSEDIQNSGVINTPDGQTILAAGKKVYLASSKDPAGFMVEVDGGGKATNLGKIVADRGNITMMGLAVNQAGTLSASTSVRANGSIHLLAQDNVDVTGVTLTGRRNGLVTLRKDSVTEVRPELTDKEETIVSQAFSTSKVNIEASLVNVDGKIDAKGGNVTINAAPISGAASTRLNDVNPNLLPSRIFLGENALIDVSGVDAIAPMSRNQLEIQLFSEQLKDNPILRDSGLFRETIFVDARKGTELLDIAPFLALKGATVAEKLSKAGTIKLATPEDLIISQNATLDVSGGSITYEPGVIKETNLSFNGKLVPISEAKPGIRYDRTDDLFVIKDPKWGVSRSWDLTGGTVGWAKQTTGIPTSKLKTTVVGARVNQYTDGDNAGGVDLTVGSDETTILTKNLVLAGNVLANTTIGAQQLQSQKTPQSGKLIASANAIEIAQVAKPLPTNFIFEDALPNSANYQSVISTDLFTNGINQLDLSKTSSVVVSDTIQLKPNGALTLGQSRGAININQIKANIIAPGADVKLQAPLTTLADGVTIRTAGNFTNDTALVGGASQISAIDGGNIQANVVRFGNNATLDASAGAWVNNKGNVKLGHTGDISFSTETLFNDSVNLQSYGFDHGGKLSVAFGTGLETLQVANNIATSGNNIALPAGFFSKGGFSDYQVSGFNINIGDHAAPSQELYTRAQTLSLNAGFKNQDDNASVLAVSSIIEAPDATRKPVSFGFVADRLNGTINLASNTTLKTDRGGVLSLAAGERINVLGDMVAPSGSIKIDITNNEEVIPADVSKTVFIGESAFLSVAGTSVVLPASQANLLNTQVFNAGAIQINQQTPFLAQKGSVVIKEGAMLDVSGASIERDTETSTGFVRETLFGDAGSISIFGVGGLLLDGAFNASASGTGRGGNLNLTSTTPTFTLTQAKQNLANNIQVGDSLTTPETQQSQLSASQMREARFANLNIKTSRDGSGGQLELTNGLDLNLPNNLSLETSNFLVKDNGAALLSANHLTLKSLNSEVDPVAVTKGDGRFSINAKQLFIDGLVTIAGVNQTKINTSLDVTGKGTRVGLQGVTATQGGLVTNGDLNITARQIFPATASKLGFEAIDGKLTINANGVTRKPILSGVGELTLKGDDVLQNGVVVAPLGQINIEAKNSATFTSNSITSVSADNQIIPYGLTVTGGEFYNQLNAKSTPPTDKNIKIKSDVIDLQNGATLDLSAGGDLFAYEWVPGIGGTQDVLAKPNTFAVLPSLGEEYAPFDQIYRNSSALVGEGQSVFLTGVPGLSTGRYTLLPARYALVPGALMVEKTSASGNLLPGEVKPQVDGSTLTSGYFANIDNTKRDANWSTFKVTDGAVFRPAAGTVSKAPSQYLLTSATTFFSNPLKTDGQDVSLPIDVAKLSLDAAKINLAANVVANKKAGGDGLEVDISASNIRVVSSTGADDGSLQLTADSINRLNADSLLLGGTRENDKDSTKLTTTAQQVTIENNASNQIKTPELLIAALDKLTVKTNAAINTGVASNAPVTKTVNSSGNGALLALSSASKINYSRSGGSPTATTGELLVEQGSLLKAGNSVVLDATKSATLADGALSLANGGSATFGANRLLIGNAPTDVLGLNLTASTLAALGQLNTLTLNSYNNVDTFGAINVGNVNLDLTINAAGIVGNLAQGEDATAVNAAPSVLTARTFTFKNTQDASFNTPQDTPVRDLNIIANNVLFDGNATARNNTEIAGFNQVNIEADSVRVSNVGNANFSVAETNINVNQITANTGADYQINSTGKLALNPLNNNAISNANNDFGATLAIAADELSVANSIQLGSGQLTLSATNDLNIENGAKINVASTANQFFTKTTNINAGSVTLTSTNADVNVNANAVIDVSSKGEANAGLVKVSAQSGSFNLQGDLRGSANGTGDGGLLDVDVNNLANLSDTNKRAVGFTEARHYRVRTGDVAITGKGADALTAKEVMVSADAGGINVSGDIIATAPKNSQIGLFANGDVTLESTAIIKANSTQAGEEGGKLKVNTKTGQLAFKQGSVIDVSGGEGAFATGEVTMRAPRTANNRDIQIAELFTDFIGAKKVQAEGFKVYNRTNIVTADLSTTTPTGFFRESETFLRAIYAADAPLLSRIAIDADTPFLVVPGVEVNSPTGNLTLGNDWNLRNWRFDPASGRAVTDAVLLETGQNRFGQDLLAGVLTLRARDNININNILNDGFSGTSLTLASRAATPAIPGTPEVPAVFDDNGVEITPAIPEVAEIPRVAGVGVTGRESWSYRIIAGSDNTAANPLTTTNAGNITIAANRGVRTGTGDIDIAAGGNLTMNAGSVLYTVGRNAEPLQGFNLPANNLAPLYLTEGGDVSIAVKGNIVGAESQAGNRQLINQWLFRQGGGSENRDTSWWVRPDLFQQSTATLGGGDISIVAGGNISNFSASAATTARFDTNGNINNQIVNGGGDVTVKAGGDIGNGVYFVAKGEGELEAGGEIKLLGNTFATTLAMQDGHFNVSAKGNLLIETALNPTLVAQSIRTPNNNTTGIDRLGSNSYFNTYSEQAGFNATSLLGDVTFGSAVSNIESLVVGLDNVPASYRYHPGTLNLLSNNGDVSIMKDVQLLPSSTGQLSLLAANDINITASQIKMSDADPLSLPSINSPLNAALFRTAIAAQLNTHAQQLLHGNSNDPVLIVADKGNIQLNTNSSTIDLPKFATVFAGNDVDTVKFNVQNNKAGDLTLIKAGNDLKVGNVVVSGPGELLLQAGRNIDLSLTQADIATVGNDGANPNPALPEQGASITLQAGLGSGAAVQRYIDQYILPTGAGPSVIANDSQALAEYKTTTAQALLDYMKKLTGNQALTNAEAFAQFNALSNESKTVFVNRHLTSELIASGKAEAAAQAKGIILEHQRGKAAIATLFPKASPGNILLFASKVSTNSGGSIDLIAPNGLINVGAPGKAFKDDIARRGDIGILTEKGGEIFAIANGDFQVNQSKVVTQFGSDIAIWSTAGTIDAGRGSKTATSVPERIVQTDAFGNTTIEVRGVAAGSGIRAQTYDPDGPNGPLQAPNRGTVFLTAPTVDAGEAGIEAGDFFAFTNNLLNASNIQISGTSSGVPVASTGAIGPVSSGLSTDAVNSAVAQVAQAVNQSLNQPVVKPSLPSIISVDVISIGK